MNITLYEERATHRRELFDPEFEKQLTHTLF